MHRLLAILVFGLLVSPFQAWATGIQARREYISHNYEAALNLARPAAERGDNVAMLILGRLYFEGKSVEKDYALANQWWRASANLGNRKAQNNMGLLFQYGLGVQKDFKEAAKWFDLSASQGEPTACYHLGGFYTHGQGVAANYEKALEFFRKAEALYKEELITDPENSEAIVKGLNRTTRDLAALENHLDILAATAAANEARKNQRR